MKLSLSTRWFLCLSLAITVFCVCQIMVMVWLEVGEIYSQGGALGEELTEISMLVSISVCVFVLMLGGLWFVSRRMIRPIHTIAAAAERISHGELRERIINSDTADEIRVLTSTLNAAFDRYDLAVTRLDEFACNTAHQLRSPLASLRSVGEVCLQKERTKEEYRECITSMLEVTMEMSTVVHKVLDLARLNPELIRHSFVSFDLATIITGALELYDPVIQEKNITIVRSGQRDLTVSGDPTLLVQAIGNILDNALRASPENETVELALESRDADAYLSIVDHGLGIVPNLKWCSRRDAGHMRDNLPGGRLGIAIACDIMDIHGGFIEIRSGKTGGTEVTLALPCAHDTNPVPDR